MADRARRRELDRLADEIVPLLIARLGDSRLGELEVRDGQWRVRVRRSARAIASETRPASAGGRDHRAGRREGRERATESARGAPNAPGSAVAAAGRLGTPSGNGETATAAAVGPGRGTGERARERGDRHDDRRRIVARSPAVGYFAPVDGLATGKLVRADDVLGQVDVLGVRQAVLAPAGGIVSKLIAQAGEAVEYGQELLQIDVVPRADAGTPRAADARSEP
jgi:biotin carboxyl carrier protein